MTALMTQREGRVRGNEYEDECWCGRGWDHVRERGAVFFLLKGCAMCKQPCSVILHTGVVLTRSHSHITVVTVTKSYW